MHHKSPVLVYLIRIAQRFFALILSPHTILFDGEQRSKEKKKKKKILLFSPGSKNNKTITGKRPCKVARQYTWFKDEETLNLIFLFLQWEINVEQL